MLTAQVWYRVMSALRPPTEATLFPRTVVDETALGASSDYKQDRQRYLLNTHGAHVFDGLRFLVGELASLRAEVASSGKDFTWHGTGRLATSGGLASFEISASVHGLWAEGFDIYGENGSPSGAVVLPVFPPCQRGDRFHRARLAWRRARPSATPTPMSASSRLLPALSSTTSPPFRTGLTASPPSASSRLSGPVPPGEGLRWRCDRRARHLCPHLHPSAG